MKEFIKVLFSEAEFNVLLDVFQNSEWDALDLGFNPDSEETELFNRLKELAKSWKKSSEEKSKGDE